MKLTVEERAIRRAESKKKSIENRHNRTILVLVKDGKVEKEYIDAAKLLFNSCASRINDCKKKVVFITTIIVKRLFYWFILHNKVDEN